MISVCPEDLAIPVCAGLPAVLAIDCMFQDRIFQQHHLAQTHPGMQSTTEPHEGGFLHIVTAHHAWTEMELLSTLMFRKGLQ